MRVGNRRMAFIDRFCEKCVYGPDLHPTFPTTAFMVVYQGFYPIVSTQWQRRLVFFFFFLEDTSPFCEATDTPVLDFWRRLS